MESKLLNCWRCICTYPFFKCCACAACISGPNSTNSMPHDTINTTTSSVGTGGFEMSFLRDGPTRNSVVIEALPQIIPNHLGPLQNHAIESFRYACAIINCFSSRHSCGHTGIVFPIRISGIRISIGIRGRIILDQLSGYPDTKKRRFLREIRPKLLHFCSISLRKLSEYQNVEKDIFSSAFSKIH